MAARKSKFLTSAAKVVGKVRASKRVVGAMPDSPARRRFQTDSMSWPRGVTQPMPVMTTRLRMGRSTLFESFFYHRDTESTETHRDDGLTGHKLNTNEYECLLFFLGLGDFFQDDGGVLAA